MKYAANVDSNQPEIVAGLRARGWSVEHLHRNGSGVPDLLVGAERVNVLLEVIGPEKLKKYRATGGLNEMQVPWHGAWRGQRAVARNLTEAIGAVEAALAAWGIMLVKDPADHVFEYIWGSDGSICGICTKARGLHPRVPA